MGAGGRPKREGACVCITDSLHCAAEIMQGKQLPSVKTDRRLRRPRGGRAVREPGGRGRARPPEDDAGVAEGLCPGLPAAGEGVFGKCQPAGTR